MLSGPRLSVRARLTLAMFLVIVASWVLSAGAAHYIVYRQIVAREREIAAQGVRLVPPRRFGWREFWFGPQGILPQLQEPGAGRRQGPLGPPNGPPQDIMGRQPPQGPPPQVPPNGPPLGRPGVALAPEPFRQGPPPPATSELAWARVASAALLALAAGAWLARWFTRPLSRLAAGAAAYRAGDFHHRIQVTGDDEFAQVADSMNAMAGQVDAQIARLEEDGRRRRQLLADVAHELRSPVTTMRTMAGAMAEGLAEDPERRQRAVDAMVRTSERLLNLVTDLLQLARADLNELPLNRRPVDVRSAARSTLEVHAAHAAQNGMTLAPVEEGPAVLVTADPDRLAQVLDNLVDNAISHAGEGATVSIRVEAGEPVRILVADTGRGIPAAHLPHVFDTFYRVDAARTPGTRHCGLGLRIARALVEAHGGTLTIGSEEGKGTTAVVTLPGEGK